MEKYSENNLPLEIEGVDVIQNELIAIDCLEKKETIARFEFGDSMFPFLKSGQFCKLVPLEENEIVEIGDIVTSIVNNNLNTHMVGLKTKVNDETWYLIVTSNWHIIGWTNKILAKAYGMEHFVTHSLESYVKQTEPQDQWFVNALEAIPLDVQYVGEASACAQTQIRIN